MRLFFLAARNLMRNLRRTLLTLSAIGFGLAIMLMMVSMQEGQYRDMLVQAVSNMAGHVVVEDRAFTEDAEAEHLVEHTSGLVAEIHRVVPEAVIAPRVMMAGLMTSPQNSVGVGLRGMDPVAEAAVTDMEDKLVRGDWLQPDDMRGVLIGVTLADRLGVELGEKVVFMGQDATGEVQSELLRVRGVYRTGSSEVDGFVAYTNLAPTQRVLGRPDAVHQITVHLDDPDRSEAVRDAIAPLIPDDLHALTWDEALPDLVAFIQIDRVSGDVMMLVLWFIVAMGVLNTLLMSVLERTREFGVLLALGMRPRRLAGLVLLEGLVLGFAGMLLGLFGGLVISAYIVAYGIDYSWMIGESMEMEGIVMSSLMKGAWDPVRMAQYCVAAVVFTVAASLYPAWHLFRLKPVEAMRHT